MAMSIPIPNSNTRLRNALLLAVDQEFRPNPGLKSREGFGRRALTFHYWPIWIATGRRQPVSGPVLNENQLKKWIARGGLVFRKRAIQVLVS